MTRKGIKKRINFLFIKEFPELKGKRRFFVLFVKDRDFFMQVWKLPFNFYFFLVDSEVFNMNDKAVDGLIIHELCHIANWNNNERQTDLMVIQKGYGVELYEQVVYAENKFNPDKNLDSKEILNLTCNYEKNFYL